MFGQVGPSHPATLAAAEAYVLDTPDLVEFTPGSDIRQQWIQQGRAVDIYSQKLLAFEANGDTKSADTVRAYIDELRREEELAGVITLGSEDYQRTAPRLNLPIQDVAQSNFNAMQLINVQSGAMLNDLGPKNQDVLDLAVEIISSSETTYSIGAPIRTELQRQEKYVPALEAQREMLNHLEPGREDYLLKVLAEARDEESRLQTKAGGLNETLVIETTANRRLEN